MKAEEKTKELTEKFGNKALGVLEYTLDIWNTKREHAIEKLNNGNRSESVLNQLEVCDRTLIYWNKVKAVINKTSLHHQQPLPAK